jgi:transcription elongation GreA/GreB family factor
MHRSHRYPRLFMPSAYGRPMRALAEQGCSKCAELRARHQAGYCCIGAGDTRGEAHDCLPMLEETFADLQRRAAHLGQQVNRLAPVAASDALDGVANGAFFVASRHLSALERVLARAQVVEPDGCVLVGSRVVLEPSDGGQGMHVELAAPDLVDPIMGRISIDSPMGAALLGHRGGETVRFHTPTGVRTVTLAAIF